MTLPEIIEAASRKPVVGVVAVFLAVVILTALCEVASGISLARAKREREEWLQRHPNQS